MVQKRRRAAEPPESLKPLLGRLLGVGSEKRCFLHPTDVSRCVKVCAKGDCVQTRREIAYFEYLKRKRCESPIIPEFYGCHESEESLWFEQECFLSVTDGGVFDVAQSLCDYITESEKPMTEIWRELESLKQEMLKKNIICCDLSGYNILRVVRDGVPRFVLVDGFGSPEAIPLAQYFPPLGRIKIERQWKKLVKRMEGFMAESARKRADS